MNIWCKIIEYEVIFYYIVNGDKEINKQAENELDLVQTPDLYDQGAKYISF
jgi:hypothetical protein